MSLSVIGVPSSAGSYAAGQDQAPRALRAAGLLGSLSAAGIEVHDAGDLAEQVWAPDRNDRAAWHFDLNTPQSTIEGALDWMGLAHALDLPGCRDELAGAFATRPVLTPARLAYLGVDPTQSTEFERDQVASLGLSLTTQADLIDDPAAAATAALKALPIAPFAVHVDVDVLDFTDAPLAENTSGRNIGPTLEQLAAALRVVTADPRWRAISIGELNPTRAAGDPTALPRFIDVLCRVLAA